MTQASRTARVKEKLRYDWESWRGTRVPPGLARRNWRLCLLIQASWTWFLGTAVISTYYTEVMHISQLEVYGLQATWAIAATAGTIPAGWFADRYGIRRVMICGTSLYLVQTTYFALCRDYWQFEIALVLSGLQLALVGGTVDAVVALSLKQTELDANERHERFTEYQHVAVLSKSFVAPLGMLLGGFLATHINMHLPFILQIGVYVVPFVASLKLVEPRQHDVSTRAEWSFKSFWADITKRRRILLVERPIIRWAVVAYVTTGATTIAGFWLIQPLMRDAGIPVAFFGWIYACYSVTTGTAAWITQRLHNKHLLVRWSVLLLAAGGGSVIAGLNLSLASPIVLLLCFSLARAGVGQTIQNHLAKQLQDDHATRATDLSIVDSIETVVFAVVGPAIGGLADGTSVHVAMLCLGGFCLTLASVALAGLHRASRTS